MSWTPAHLRRYGGVDPGQKKPATTELDSQNCGRYPPVERYRGKLVSILDAREPGSCSTGPAHTSNTGRESIHSARSSNVGHGRRSMNYCLPWLLIPRGSCTFRSVGTCGKSISISLPYVSAAVPGTPRGTFPEPLELLV